MMTIEQEAHVGMFLRRALEFVLAGGVFVMGLGILLLDGMWQHDLYRVLETVAPDRVWGTLFLVLGAIRCVVLVINGFWPLSPAARLTLAVSTLIIAWFPLAISYLAYFRSFLTGDGGGFIPGLALVGIAIFTEALCLYALSALQQARRHVG